MTGETSTKSSADSTFVNRWSWVQILPPAPIKLL
jgi:hypothetical protein